jgi:dipeptidyl aminopeptidase/acylaminoacyl peptidase
MQSQIEIQEFNPNARLYLVTYLSQGFKVKGYLAIPRKKGPFPLLVYCRGGIRNVGMTRLAWVKRFVEAGYIVFAPFYRGNRGGEGREDFCGEALAHPFTKLKI